MTIKKQHKTPCRECPFKKTSARGYLGASHAVEFLDISESGQHMPCHMKVKYEEDDWQEQARNAPQCAGRAIHYANRCKTTRGTAVMEAKVDEENIITWPQDFINHHTPTGDIPQVIIIGNRVIAS